ncbi:MAG: bifunctional tetrahydrofolate synthase/dihydrofolate synthase [Pseudomonadota bacterium]
MSTLPDGPLAASRTLAPAAQSSLEDWLAYLETINARVIEMGLARVRDVWRRLGLAPAFPVITVAGTNGKGSTCAMLESILSRAGYRTGCYTSPHLVRYNERVRIDREPVADAPLVAAFAEIEQARGATPLTYFEVGTLAAMMLFIRQQVDVAILEVGLGGRLDAVNVFDNDVAVVSGIDFDHMEYLGNTREEIGFEKAGVFKRGRAAVCADPDPPASIEGHARDVGCDLLQIGRDFGYVAEGQQWTYWGYGVRRAGLPYPALRGAFQLRNAAACLAVLDEIKDRLPVSMGQIRRGLAEVELPGRFQVLPGRPAVVLDVAHNPQAARALADNLAGMGPFRRTLGVLAMLRDKDIAAVVESVAPRIDAWRVASLPGVRGAQAAVLEEVLRRRDPAADVVGFAAPVDAYLAACAEAGEDDRIVVFGSFLTVADIIAHRGRGEAR